jgi:hypothetical protein
VAKARVRNEELLLIADGSHPEFFCGFWALLFPLVVFDTMMRMNLLVPNVRGL